MDLAGHHQLSAVPSECTEVTVYSPTSVAFEGRDAFVCPHRLAQPWAQPRPLSRAVQQRVTSLFLRLKSMRAPAWTVERIPSFVLLCQTFFCRNSGLGACTIDVASVTAPSRVLPSTGLATASAGLVTSDWGRPLPVSFHALVDPSTLSSPIDFTVLQARPSGEPSLSS
eukprot:COSAG02_NODE_346_length_24113_cov_13.213001_3_plen_169_part_00